MASRAPISLILLALFSLAPLSRADETVAAPDKIRKVHFVYATEIGPIDTHGRVLNVWIPLPRTDAHQSVSRLRVSSDLPNEILDLGSSGNSVVHLHAKAPLPRSTKVEISFDATRREEAAKPPQPNQSLPDRSDAAFARWLQPDRLVPIDGRIAQVSASIPGAQQSPQEQARAIYEYVTATMKYDKTGTGWGRGDAVYACNVKKGNCTDFHSLLIALDRNRKIPARFIIGFPLEQSKSGDIAGYHCWAEFYSGGVWVPVDASEAWKHPERHEYYFGHLDADRIAFTMGRDLDLVPRQKGGALNFLIYPYAELDGVPLDKAAIKNHFGYKDLD